MDTAWATLRESGPRFAGRDVATRDAIAKYIVDLAMQGERNRQRLIDGDGLSPEAGTIYRFAH